MEGFLDGRPSPLRGGACRLHPQRARVISRPEHDHFIDDPGHWAQLTSVSRDVLGRKTVGGASLVLGHLRKVPSGGLSRNVIALVTSISLVSPPPGRDASSRKLRMPLGLPHRGAWTVADGQHVFNQELPAARRHGRGPVRGTGRPGLNVESGDESVFLSVFISGTWREVAGFLFL